MQHAPVSVRHVNRRPQTHRAAPSEVKRDPRDTDEPTPEMVQERLARSRVIPRVLTVPCPVGHADVGERCYVHGVCWQRVVLRAGKP